MNRNSIPKEFDPAIIYKKNNKESGVSVSVDADYLEFLELSFASLLKTQTADADADSVTVEPLVRVQNPPSVGVEFTCKCGKQKGWVYEDKETMPCPNCGRKYVGKYNAKDLTIDGIEVLSV